MAKYLGGINDPDISVVDIKTPGLLCYDFLLVFYNTAVSKDLISFSISDSIIRYDELSAESKKHYSLSWGTLGYLTIGPVGGLIGAVLGGNTTEKHVVLCELRNGWQLALALDQDEYKNWVRFMGRAIRINT